MIHFECFHGTTLQAAEKILAAKKFKAGNNVSASRLGRGVYFFAKESQSSYALQCAEAYCTQKYKNPDPVVNEVAVLRCMVSCQEDELFDLYNPELLEIFHVMRYAEYAKLCEKIPGYVLQSSEELDTAVLNDWRENRKIAVVRSPQYFSLLANEKSIKTSKNVYRRTNLPNTLMVCADENLAEFSDIEIVKRRVLTNDESAGYVG